MLLALSACRGPVATRLGKSEALTKMDQDDAMAARGADAGHNGSERNPDAPAAAAGPVDEAGDTEEEETTDEEESGEGDDSDDYEDEGDDVDIAEEEGARVAVEQVRRNGMFMRLLNRLVHGRYVQPVGTGAPSVRGSRSPAPMVCVPCCSRFSLPPSVSLSLPSQPS